MSHESRETAGIETMRALSQEQIVKLRIVPENVDRSESAPRLNSPQERLSGVHRIQENFWRSELCPLEFMR